MLSHLFDGAIPKELSDAELVPLLRRLGVTEAAVIVPMVEAHSRSAQLIAW